eukprot:m.184132 g.184132  ORF g.184132 m.184132 type:complete len:413 (+) comp16043_c0_seq1:85-1323(+)
MGRKATRITSHGGYGAAPALPAPSPVPKDGERRASKRSLTAIQTSFEPWESSNNSAVYNFMLDLFASFYSMGHVLSGVQTILVAILAIGSPCFFFYYRDPDEGALSFNMNWTLISIAVLFPLTMSVTSAFNRREQAILDLAALKADILSIYYAHRDWSWPTREEKLREGHVRDVRFELMGLIAKIKRMLRSPNVTKGRHRFSTDGRLECIRIRRQLAQLEYGINRHFSNLSKFVEEMKEIGFPGNEASRMRQYFTRLITSYEHLRSLKSYRTPLGIRAFARAFILLTPIVMGPYYAYLAGAGEEAQFGVGLPFACFFSFLASMSMQGLFSIRVWLEDPFFDGQSKKATDTIDLHEQFVSVIRVLNDDEEASGATLAPIMIEKDDDSDEDEDDSVYNDTASNTGTGVVQSVLV